MTSAKRKVRNRRLRTKLPDDPRTKEALALALRKLAVRGRFGGEIAAELCAIGYEEPVVAAALGFLQDHRLLDDGRAFENLLQAKSGRNAAGREKLRQILERKGASPEQIEEWLGQITAEDELESMATALAAKPWPPGSRAKAWRFLASRGFDPELIETALERRFGKESY